MRYNIKNTEVMIIVKIFWAEVKLVVCNKFNNKNNKYIHDDFHFDMDVFNIIAFNIIKKKVKLKILYRLFNFKILT